MLSQKPLGNHPFKNKILHHFHAHVWYIYYALIMVHIEMYLKISNIFMKVYLNSANRIVQNTCTISHNNVLNWIIRIVSKLGKTYIP